MAKNTGFSVVLGKKQKQLKLWSVKKHKRLCFQLIT